VENRNSWKAGFGSAENVIQEKRRQDFSSFFDNFFNPRVFFEAASGFYYPLSVLGWSLFGRRRARSTTTDKPRTDNETRSRLKTRWAHRLKAYVPQATGLPYNNR
jgi:hypothetical protein